MELCSVCLKCGECNSCGYVTKCSSCIKEDVDDTFEEEAADDGPVWYEEEVN